MKTEKCCICGKTFEGYGNNPRGALNENREIVEWRDEDRCCDECNNRHVVPGRIMLMMRNRAK